MLLITTLVFIALCVAIYKWVFYDIKDAIGLLMFVITIITFAFVTYSLYFRAYGI